MAKLLAYADCTIRVAITNSDPRLCDCNRIIAAESTPIAGDDQPDKQKELTLKADWKYVGVVSFQFPHTLLLVEKNNFDKFVSFVPEQIPQSIFHPPQS